MIHFRYHIINALLILFFLIQINMVQAAEYNGHARFGVIDGQVDLPGNQQAESNDVKIISTRLNLDYERINRQEDFVRVDVRDKYDFFGKVNSEIFQLDAQNELQLRELTYERPWENNRSFYSLGRSSIPEAGILANDGGEYGYRYSRNLRIVGFAGIAPEDIVTPASIRADVQGFDGTQFGVYTVYETKNPDRMRSTYMVNSIAQSPSFELNDFVNHLYFYHHGTFNLGFSQRLSSFASIDLAPNINLRRGFFSYGYFKRRYRYRASITRITAEDYRLKKDIRDDLEPSTLTSAAFNGKYRMNVNLQLDANLSSATRSLDSLRSNELSAGFLYTGFLRKKLSLGAKYGIRQAFLSDDTFIIFQASYYQQNWNLFTSYTTASEKYEEGGELNPKTIHLELAYFLYEDIRGSVAYTQSDAEDRSLNTFLLMIGYQFGSSTGSPIRRRVPDFGDI